MTVSNYIALLGGIALFLFGITLMGDALKKVAGNKLEVVLYRLSGTKMKAVLLGIGVTAVIQSSTATSVMAVGFVNSGMMQFAQAANIVLGSTFGTSATGWIICLSYMDGGSGIASVLSTATITGIAAVVGIYLRKFTKKQANQHIGEIFMGFAVLMYGMSAMGSSVSPLRESPVFLSMLTSFTNPLIGILAGTVFTALVQSASAAVGVIQALAVTGAMTLESCFPLLLGVCIGSSVPVLVSAFGASPKARRTAAVYLVVNVLGVVVFGSAFYIRNAVRPLPILNDIMTPVTVAAWNSGIRLVTVIALTPATKLVEKLASLVVPDEGSDLLESDMDRLEDRFIAHPTLAIEQSRIVASSMASLVNENVRAALALFEDYSDAGFHAVDSMESLADRYEDKLGTYLLKINANELDSNQNGELYKILHSITDLERISDHAENLAENAREIREKKLTFSPAATHELQVLKSAIREIMDISIRTFSEGDLELAYHVEPLEDVIDDLCDALKSHHTERLRDGVCSLTQGFVFNDMLTNYERIADHCSNLAVAEIEKKQNSFDSHEYMGNLKSKHTDTFDYYRELYAERYSI